MRSKSWQNRCKENTDRVIFYEARSLTTATLEKSGQESAEHNVGGCALTWLGNRHRCSRHVQLRTKLRLKATTRSRSRFLRGLPSGPSGAWLRQWPHHIARAQSVD